MVFVIAVAAIMLPILFGLGIGAALAQFDHVIEVTKDEIANKDQGFNSNLTLGYKIRTTKDAGEQVKDARKLAAKIAASQPRGANMRIGNVYQPTLKTAWQGVDEDPLTAARIAEYHGWEGVRTGATDDDGAAVADTSDAPVLKIKVYPGKDYTAVPITAAMSLEEKRKARIANAKAKWAAYKLAKAEGRYTVIESSSAPAPEAAAAAAAAPAVEEAPAAQKAAPAESETAVSADIAGIPKPNIIEITDDMDSDAKKKARISNAKANSAYKKALKAAGIDPKTVKI